MIRIEHLKKQYDNGTAPFSDICCEIRTGDVISVIGPSGTGKSTFLRCINMLDPPTEGRIFLDDEEITRPGYDLTALRRRVGMVFQSFHLFENMTAIENVMDPQRLLLRRSKKEAYDRGIELLKKVGMAEKALNYPSAMSGGQKQRVAIARALAMDPEVILFDEPTSALDPTMVGEVEAVIRSLAAEGRTMLIVTHEMRFAKEVSNRVFLMAEGGIYDDGTPQQIFDDPQKELTKRFIRRLKVLEFEITSGQFDFPDLISSLNLYGEKNCISRSAVSRAQLIVEELLMQTLLPQLGDHFNAKITFEYNADDQHLTVDLLYDGPERNPLEQSGDGLSARIISAYSDQVDYTFRSGETLTNAVHILLK